jgi:hypothetical protein
MKLTNQEIKNLLKEKGARKFLDEFYIVSRVVDVSQIRIKAGGQRKD